MNCFFVSIQSEIIILVCIHVFGNLPKASNTHRIQENLIRIRTHPKCRNILKQDTILSLGATYSSLWLKVPQVK